MQSIKEPWDGPVITRSYSIRRSCVVVEWDPPLQTNGAVTEYMVCFKTILPGGSLVSFLAIIASLKKLELLLNCVQC